MGDSQTRDDYLSALELSALTGISTATIWRLKGAGMIPFFQPGGKGTLVRFPKDAIKSMTARQQSPASGGPDLQKQLPGPRPKWMSPPNNKNE